jgi:4,5-DOPA dioxygenase extradiol
MRMPVSLSLPSLFISHGAPTYALSPGEAGAQLAALGRRFLDDAPPKAILMVSPHWMTRQLTVCTSEQPKTIHDFGGFPAPLYRLQYPANGAPEMANLALSMLNKVGLSAVASDQYGLDHGAWVPLMHMFPEANVPVFQVSLPVQTTLTSAFALGRALKPLAAQGVLIIGSGSLTHNLYEIAFDSSSVAPYVDIFQQWIRKIILAGDIDSLCSADRLAPAFARAHPTIEHFLPLLVAAGAADFDQGIDVLQGGVQHHVVSMESYLFGAKYLH